MTSPLFLLSAGGSEFGMSYWSAVLPCPLAHYKQYREKEYKPSFGKGCAETGKLNPTFVGTLVHAYLEAYYTTSNTSQMRFQVAGEYGNEDLSGFEHEEREAWRLAQAYFKQADTALLVDEVEPEILLEDSSGQLGVPKLTSRVDMVSRVRWDEYPSGRYLWEHKTAASSSKHLFEEHRVQVQVNMYLWNKQFPDKPVLGGILNNIVKTKEPKFERVMIPLAGEKELDNITKSLTFVYEIHERHGQQMVATKKTCTGGFYGPCSFYKECW